MYQLSPQESIKDFVARHGGAATGAIIEYMSEVYGVEESATRVYLSDLARAGQLAPRAPEGRRDSSGERANSYQVPDEDVAPDGLSDWG